jgi:hypothetical protein
MEDVDQAHLGTVGFIIILCANNENVILGAIDLLAWEFWRGNEIGERLKELCRGPWAITVAWVGLLAR